MTHNAHDEETKLGVCFTWDNFSFVVIIIIITIIITATQQLLLSPQSLGLCRWTGRGPAAVGFSAYEFYLLFF